MYSIETNYLTEQPEVCNSSRTARGKAVVGLVWLLAILLLISAGITYRVLASHLKLVVETPIALPIPLNAFPIRVGNWTGKDVPISESVQRVAGNDDFLNRLYVNETSGEWVNVYIGYTARPRTMLGHRPEICYVGSGWVHDSTEQTSFISRFGRYIPCLVQRFHMPEPRNDEIVVLNYYILNGEVTADEKGFSGVGVRTPNIAGDPARYVTQVQISSILENSTLNAAVDFTDLILDFFPDRKGNVRAVEYTNSVNNDPG